MYRWPFFYVHRLALVKLAQTNVHRKGEPQTAPNVEGPADKQHSSKHYKASRLMVLSVEPHLGRSFVNGR